MTKSADPSSTKQNTTSQMTNLDWYIASAPFCEQAVSGPMMALLNVASRAGTILQVDGLALRELCKKQSTTLTVFLVKYLNNCWHSYFREDDEFVVENFKILQSGPIKGMVCTMNHVLMRCRLLMALFQNKLNSIDEASLAAVQGLDQVRSFVGRLLFDCRLEVWASVENTSGCRGDEQCNNTYDGSDIFTIRT